ncbi:hypothetical protein BLNAU_14192 [Blattamonas nauphoetae]|uniref:Uncharacterized protein n=1 Tax=Blattamonas nauphoetae TaxID=2049346 RepID=A0ABQ9XL75_9EUKA|nr:hypothetical protein BLNAU_14192 [Blattamonas nauphoetae]
MFVDTIIVLLVSSPKYIARDTLFLVDQCLQSCSPSYCLALISSKLLTRILSTPRLNTLSVVADKRTLNNILILLNFGAELSSIKRIQSLSTASNTNPEDLGVLVLQEVLIPMEPSLIQISRNHRLLSWSDDYNEITHVMLRLFKASAFHQPTLTFLCSSHIPMAFQSLLSKVEHEVTHQLIIWHMFKRITAWKANGVEIWSRGRVLLQTLESEGFFEGLEQTLLHDKSTRDGKTVRITHNKRQVTR